VKKITVLSFLLAASAWASPPIHLLDQGLERFEVWMGIPHISVTGLPEGTFQSDNVTEGTPVGLDADVKDVFTIIHENGEPVLTVSGEIYGGLTNLESFENYHFSVEFKWGNKKLESGLDQKQDSGLLFHCYDSHGEFWGVWKRSLESQIQEADFGDFIGLSGTKADIRVAAHLGAFLYDPQSETYEINRVDAWANPEPDKPNGEWDLLDLYTIGDTAIHVVNGIVVMVLENTTDYGGKPPTRGQLQLQSEGAWSTTRICKSSRFQNSLNPSSIRSDSTIKIIQ
jgi:hypothetical protein